jgi:hypothetical protein
MEGLGMFIVAMTNQFPNNRFLFFFEFDNVDEFDVFEEANFLSQYAEIDIDVNLSSPRCYHLVSYDILSREEVLRVQRMVSLQSDHYLAVDEVFLYRATAEANRLRLGEKFDKPSPIFLKRFCHNKKHKKSLQHIRLAVFWYGTPIFKALTRYENARARMCVYKTGIGIKRFHMFENPRLQRLEIKRCDRKT